MASIAVASVLRQASPQHELDVAGCIASHARVGRAGEMAWSPLMAIGMTSQKI